MHFQVIQTCLPFTLTLKRAMMFLLTDILHFDFYTMCTIFYFDFEFGVVDISK